MRLFSVALRALVSLLPGRKKNAKNKGLGGGLPGADARACSHLVLAARQWQRAHAVSRRWRSLSNIVTPWHQLRTMDDETGLNWNLLRIEHDDPGHAVWAASSTSREEGKQDKWHTVRAPGEDRSVILVRKCNEEGVSYDVVRWMGCLQAMHHPCIASLQLARASHNPAVAEHTMVHAGMEWVDTSVQKIVYGTLERTSHTIFGRALPPLMLRSFMYQLLHALAWSHARGVAHGNLAPFRVLAKVRSARVLRNSPLAWAVDGSGTDPTPPILVLLPLTNAANLLIFGQHSKRYDEPM